MLTKNINRTAAALFTIGALALSASPAKASIVYDNTPAVLPGNVVSLGYEATQTAEFGNAITLAGTDRDLTVVKIIMSDWAQQTDFPAIGDATGYDEAVTLNFYNPGSGTSVGSLITSETETVHVPWHTANGFNGTAFTVAFNFSNVVLPDTVIFGVAYNTANYGAAPIGTDGPYDSLNYGLSTVGPSVGTNVNPDAAYWNTTTPANYADSGTAGVGIFRQDTNWTPYSALIQISAVPEPTSFTLLGVGSLMLLRRRRA